MVLKSSSPGVQHTEEAWEIATDVLLDQGQLLDRLRGCLEQSGVTGRWFWRMKERSCSGTVNVIRK